MNSNGIKALVAQAVKFGLVGVVNTLIDWLVYGLLTMLPFFAAYYWLTKAISFSCGVTNSLLMNRRFTFRDRERMTRARVLKFWLVNCAALGVSLGVISLCVELAHMPLFAANVCATLFSMAVNFIGNKLFVFKA